MNTLKNCRKRIRFGTLNAEKLIKPFCKSNDETNTPVIKTVIMLLIKRKQLVTQLTTQLQLKENVSGSKYIGSFLYGPKFVIEANLAVLDN